MSSGTAQARLRNPQQLYEDWERSHWAPRDVDLTKDPSDWRGVAADERHLH
jgi:ribonucleotide reductase beta subunit family protein with ferritin-like domain